VLIVDEFSALASSTSMATRVEQARGFHTSLILAPQVLAGMGEPEQVERILGSIETVVCHRVNTPERIVALAGTRRRPEYSMRYDREGVGGDGSVRMRDRLKVEPNLVRALEPGQAYLISRGRAMRAQILTAPALSRALPVSSPPASAPAAGAPSPAGAAVTPSAADPTGSTSAAGQERTSAVPPSGRLSEEEVANLPF
jgi:hypothetical protein